MGLPSFAPAETSSGWWLPIYFVCPFNFRGGPDIQPLAMNRDVVTHRAVYAHQTSAPTRMSPPTWPFNCATCVPIVMVPPTLAFVSSSTTCDQTITFFATVEFSDTAWHHRRTLPSTGPLTANFLTERENVALHVAVHGHILGHHDQVAVHVAINLGAISHHDGDRSSPLARPASV